MTMPSESHPPVPLPHPDGPLAPYRVLDFSDVKGQLCGRLLAELGADVIKVEPRGGDPTRERGPFYRDQPGREHSLVWWALNAGKRSITLELRLEEGRELARRLAEHADIVIQTFQPGEARALGLDYATLARRNPGIVVVSITNFGLTGPYRAKEATDIVGSAMGGHMMLNGDPERGPVRTTVPQAYTQVNVQACVGALIALYGRWNNGGRGQLVDVSMQEAMANTMDNAQQIWDIRRVNPRGPGIRRNRDGVPGPRYLYEAADGWVACLAYGGLVGPTSEAIVAWLAEHGEAGALTTAAWRDRLRGAQPLTPEEGAYLEERLAAFCRRFPKEWLVAEAQRRGAGWAPVYSPREIVECEQLRAREYWVRVHHEDLGETFVYPGAPFRLSKTPWRQRGRAPRVGEHNHQVYGELLGLDAAALRRLRLRMVI